MNDQQDEANNKMKPIKVALHNEQDKEKILNKLQNLKVNTEYKGISITQDYTVSERQMIKEFANKANSSVKCSALAQFNLDSKFDPIFISIYPYFHHFFSPK